MPSLSFFFKNISPRQTVFKNALWLIFGQTSGRLCRTVLLIYAARVLGAASWGAFSYALSVAAFLSIFADLGLNAFITRELSKPETSSELSHRYIATGLIVKLSIILFLLLLIIPLSPRLTAIPEAKLLLPIAVLIFAFDSLRDFASAISRSLEKMQIESAANLITNFVIVLSGFSFLLIQPSSTFLIWSYVLGSGLGAIFIFSILSSYFKNIIKGFSFSLAKTIIKISLPFSVLTIMGAAMINTDIIILGWLRSAAETGFYSAAQRPIQVLYLIPSLFAASLFPLMSKRRRDKIAFRHLLEKSLTLTLLIALPLSLGGSLLATPLISLLFGAEYMPAASAFSILSLTIALVFPSIILGNAAFALNAQKKLIAFSVFGITGNLILDLLLIPSFGVTGTALATLINQFIINAYLYFKMTQINPFSLFSNLKKIAFAVFIMSLFAYLLAILNISVFLIIPLSASLYGLLLYLFKEPVLKDLFSLINSRQLIASKL